MPNKSNKDLVQDFITANKLAEGDRARWGQAMQYGTVEGKNVLDLFRSLSPEEKASLKGASSNVKGNVSENVGLENYMTEGQQNPIVSKITKKIDERTQMRSLLTGLLGYVADKHGHEGVADYFYGKANEQVQRGELAKKVVSGDMTVEEAADVGKNAAANVGQGSLKSIEGMIDFLITEGASQKVSAIGPDTDALKTVAKHLVKYDATADLFGRDAPGEGKLDTQWGNEWSQASEAVLGKSINSFVEDTSQGFGGMLPEIAASAAGAPELALNAMFFAQAAGQGTEDALKRGATFDAASLYGRAVGGVELLTEKLGGIGFEGKTQKGFIGKLIDTVAPGTMNRILASTGGRALWTYIGEGTEGVLSDIIRPFLDYAVGLGDLSWDTWKEVFKGLPETFNVGGSTGVLLNGLSSGITNIQNHHKGGSHYVNITRSMDSILKAEEANEAVKASTKKSQKVVDITETETNKFILEEANKISKEMKQLTAEQRAALFEEAPILEAFVDKNGNVKSEVTAAMQSQISSGKSSNTSETIFDANAEAANLAKVAEQVGKSVEYDSDPLTPAERKNMASLLDANRQVNEFMVNSSMDDAKAKVVIYKGADSAIKGFTAPITLGNTVYISRSSLSDGTAIQKYIHEELGHQQGISMDRAALSELSSDTELRNKAISDLSNTDNQGYSAEEISEIISRGEKGEVLTGAEAKVFDEYGARLLEFGLDAKSISRITQENPTGLRKISSAISDFVESRKNRKLTESERNRLQALRRAERNIRMSLENTRAERNAAYNATVAARSEYLKDRSKYLSLDESERAKFLKDRGYTAEDFAPGVLEKEDVSTLPQKYREEYLAASKEEGKTKLAKTKKAAEAGDKEGDVKFSKEASSEKDSSGRTLSVGQAEYFKDSKVRDEDGRLMLVYHGSPAVFTEFSHDFMSSNGSSEGQGFYFTDKKSMAEGYQKDGGQLLEGYLNISKPLSDSEKTLKKSEVRKLLKAIDPTGDDVIINYDPSGKGYPSREWYNRSLEEAVNMIFDYADTDSEILAEIANSGAGAETTLKTAKDVFGYDGYIVSGKYKGANVYVSFTSEQFKNADNLSPTSNPDIRFSKVDPRPGQSKVYSRQDAKDVVSAIVESRMEWKAPGQIYVGKLSKTAFTQAASKLFEQLNQLDPGKRGGAALDLANYIVERAVVETAWDVSAPGDDVLERAGNIVDVVNSLRHKLDFKGHYGDLVMEYDKKGAKGIRLQFQVGQGKRGIGLDQIKDLFDEIGVTIESDNPIDIFKEAMDLYEEAKKEINYSTKAVRLSKFASDAELEKIKQEIASDLLKAYDEKGTPSMLKTRLDQTQQSLANERTASQQKIEKVWEKVSDLKNALADERGIAKQYTMVLRDLRFLRGATNRTYVVKNNLPISVNLLSNPSFTAVAKVVSNTMFGDRISPKRVREAMFGLRDTFLTENNKIFDDWVKSFADETGKNPIIEDISNNILPVIDRMTQAIGDGETVKDLSDSPLTYAEWRAFRKVAALVKKVYTSYDAFYENGKRYVLSEKVRDWQQSIDFANKTRTGKVRFLDKTFDSFERSFVTPIVWAQSVDGYDPDGFFTHFVQKLTADSWLQQIEQQRIDKIVDGYIKKTKGYEKRLKERIPFDGKSGKKILRSEAIDIYLQSTQENGFLTLTAERGGGVYYTNERGEKSPDVLKYSAQSLQDLYNSFSQEDKDFIETVLKGYEEVGKLRRDANIRLMGFSDDVKGRYYPIFRDQGSIQRDPTTVASFMKDIATANNISANKKRRAEALVIPLQARNVADKFYQHVRQLTMFSAFAEDLQNLRRAYGLDLSSTLGGKETIQKMLEDGFPIKTASGETKSVATTYFVKLLNDIQGVSARDTTKIDRIIRTARGNYAKATLNLNIKVGLSQLASIPNAMQYIDPTVMARAAVAFRDPSKIKERMKDMDKYSQTAYIRTLTNVAMQSEALLDKMGNVTDKLGFLINFNDRMAIAFLWKCAQLQVAKDYGYKLGSEDNLKAAGELLDQINTNTQPTYQATDKSGFQRNQNELFKSFAMFKSVPTKQISMILSAYGEAFTLPRQIKYIEQQLQDQNISGDTRKALEAKLKDLEKRSKAAKGNAAKATVAVVLAQAMYTVLGSAVMRFILRKDDEKPFGESLLFSFINSLVSIVPIAGQLYDFFMNGRELSEVSVASVDTFLTDIGTVFNGMMSGKDEQTKKGFRNLAIDAGMISGVPVRNIRNLFLGVIKSADPERADRYSYAFTAPKTTDVAAAMQKGETALANDLTSRIMASKGFSISSEQASVLSDLVNKGYSLPSGTITQYTIDGTTYTLTEKERDNFALVYADAAGAADQVVSNSAFAKFSDDGKNKAISYIYSYYKDKAKVEAVGIDASKLYLFGTAIDPASLALVLAGIDDLLARAKASGKEYNRKTLITEYLKRQDLTAAQKYMLMGYFGYKNTNGAEQVKSYINRLQLTKKEKQALYEKSGYGG